MFCLFLIVFFSDFEDVELLAVGCVVEGDRSALLVLLVSTTVGVFGRICPLNANGASVPLLLLLMGRLGDVDICLDVRKEGRSRGMIDFGREMALL